MAQEGGFDGYLAVGGGSVIDTAKAADLYATYPADFLAYVNAPVGEGLPCPARCARSSRSRPRPAPVPRRRARPCSTWHRSTPRPGSPIASCGRTSASSTRTSSAACLRWSRRAPGSTSCAMRSSRFTNLPFDRRPAPLDPARRPAYQGRNPVSDVWAAKTLEVCARYLVRAVHDAADDEAREAMLLAATYAGIGFGNAGLHLCHAMAYPIAGQVRDYRPPDYPDDHPMVPHGMSVVLTAPAVSASPCRARHVIWRRRASWASIRLDPIPMTRATSSRPGSSS